jgi:serpin B
LGFNTGPIGLTNCNAPPTPDAGVVSGIVSGNTELAIKLFSQITTAADGGNAFYSPLSVSTALAMTYAGAEGSTATQMAQVLQFNGSASDLHAGFGALACELEADGQTPDGGQIDLANAVFGQRGETFESPFLSTLQNDYGAPFQPLDFAADPATALQDINAWVAAQTRGNIPQVLSPGAITSDTRMVLANALYFQELWSTPFDPESTRTGTFHTPQQTVQVPMMTGVINAGFLQGNGLVMVELPFSNGKTAMDLILPSTGTLSSVEATLTAANLAGWIGQLTREQVMVTIPKFKIDLKLDLIPSLQALGLALPFDPQNADFSGIDGAHDLFISLLRHEAVLSVDELGATATAATVVGIAGSAAPSWQATFDADSPFLVLIRHVPTGAILFIGQVTDPSAG